MTRTLLSGVKERDPPVLYSRTSGKSSVVSVLGVPAGAGEVGQGADGYRGLLGGRRQEEKAIERAGPGMIGCSRQGTEGHARELRRLSRRSVACF